jgi:hypothetical protein
MRIRKKDRQIDPDRPSEEEDRLSVPKVFSFEPETFAKEINSLAKGQVSALTSQD